MTTTMRTLGWEIAYAELAACNALDYVGRKLNHYAPARRTMRGQAHAVDTWDRHTLCELTDEQVDTLLDGAFRVLDRQVPPGNCLRSGLEHYVRWLVTTQTPHSRDTLIETINRCLGEQ